MLRDHKEVFKTFNDFSNSCKRLNSLSEEVCEDNEILLCKGCNLTVQANCYGMFSSLKENW